MSHYVDRKPVCPCGKVCFDKRGAQTKRNDLMRRGQGRLDIYACPVTQFWHLTSKKRFRK